MGHPTEPGSQSDAELVAAYRAGDERAATELVTRHARAVARYLYGAGAADGEVDDLAQEAFFRAFRKLGTWRGDASFRSWLITIAGNLLKDEYRRRKGRTVVSIEGRDIPDRADPEGELAAHEAGDRLRECLQSLPRLQRDVFLLRVQQGADYAEIAQALGTTPGAARVHYHHAVKRLKESIK
ncbi:MAG: sigma-70 family RNA polymerase sigma factor [Gemmatimonadales bacterium]